MLNKYGIPHNRSYTHENRVLVIERSLLLQKQDALQELFYDLAPERSNLKLIYGDKIQPSK